MLKLAPSHLSSVTRPYHRRLGTVRVGACVTPTFPITSFGPFVRIAASLESDLFIYDALYAQS